MQAAFAGVDLGKTEKDKNKKLEEAKAKLKDPLKDFPNDVTYLDAKACGVKIRLTNNPKLQLPFEQKWDEYRKECCIGRYGLEARRCSMNNTLWGRYLKSIESNKPLNLPVIKAMIEFDMIRRELYPPDYKGDENVTPPEDYIRKLKTSGEYTNILQRLDAVTKKVQTYGGTS